MAMRVKNIAAGFVDATGFHPIRRSPDYDPDRRGSHGGVVDEYGSKKDSAGLKYARKRKKKAKTKVRAKVHRRRTVKRAVKRTTKRRTTAKRKSNPISAQWVKAQVRRIGEDIQVMLFPKASKRRRAARTTRRRVARIRRR